MTDAEMAFEITTLGLLLGISEDDARLVFQDIAVEAAGASASGTPSFERCLSGGLEAFRASFIRAPDVLSAQLAASQAIAAI